MVESSVRRRALIRRCGPVLLTVGYLFLIGAVGDRVALPILEKLEAQNLDLNAVPSDDIFHYAAILIAIAIATILIPVILWLSVLLVRTAKPSTQRAVGFLGLVMMIIVPVVIDPQRTYAPIEGVVAAAVIVGGAYAGLGTILMWSLRRTVRELWTLGPMTVRVLPVLMLAILFFFYNAEIWQIADALSPQRAALTAIVLIALTAALIVVQVRDELSEAGVLQQLREMVPAARRIERLNVLLVAATVTGIQVAIFSLLVFLFFIVFGALSVPIATITQWSGHPPSYVLPFAHQSIPITHALIKVSAVLGVFAGLNFTASTGIDKKHRKVFFFPILDEVKTGLEVRERYLQQP